MKSSSCALLITGPPGIGKTTLIKRVVATFPELDIAGFYTEEIRANAERQGFELVALQGVRFVMAHIDNDSIYRVGRYGVDIEKIDKAVELVLPEERNAELYIIDEIGKMECFSGIFIKKIAYLLDSKKPLLATIALKGRGFIAEAKNRPGIELWEVTRQNRNEMVDKITSWIKGNLQNS